MSKVYAVMIQKGILQLDQVPVSHRGQVEELLILADFVMNQ